MKIICLDCHLHITSDDIGNYISGQSRQCFISLLYICLPYISIKLQWGSSSPFPERWRMCSISYSIPWWWTAISCGECRSSKMIYYAEMHWQTVENLAWLIGIYYTENPSIRFMFVTFQYYCICWMSKLPRLKVKHHKIMMTDQFECAFVTGFRDKIRRICHI